jgi:hypothetical protein
MLLAVLGRLQYIVRMVNYRVFATNWCEITVLKTQHIEKDRNML